MAPKAREALQQLFQSHSELDGEVCKELVSLYDRKLWHQLSHRLRELFKDPQFQPYLQELFDGFIVEFGHKMNLLLFAQFAHDVAKSLDRDAAVAMLTKHAEGLKTLKGFPVAEPLLFLDMSIAEHCIDVAHMDECKERLEAGKKQLDSMADVDPVVSAAVHNVAALFAKARQDFTGYYRAALQYLSYVTVDEVPEDERLALARDISLAALLGDSVFSFAELLLHPIVKALEGTSYAWLADLLLCFSDGDMARYERLCHEHAAAMNAQPGLVLAQRQLKQKVTIMCLVAMVSGLPPDKRRIPLAAVAARTQLDVDGAEFLLMRAMSLKLVSGTIDEIGGTVDVRHVAPRVLTMAEVAALKENVAGWMGKVDGAAALLAAEGVSAVEAAA